VWIRQASGRRARYRWIADPSALGGALDACHSLDVPLAFGTLDGPVAARPIGDEPDPEAVTLSHELEQAWIRFVTTGDAGWAAHRPGQRLTRVLDAGPQTLPYRDGLPPDLGRPRPGPPSVSRRARTPQAGPAHPLISSRTGR
jgi:carboxylesterase type B